MNDIDMSSSPNRKENFEMKVSDYKVEQVSPVKN